MIRIILYMHKEVRKYKKSPLLFSYKKGERNAYYTQIRTLLNEAVIRKTEVISFSWTHYYVI